MCFPRSWDCCGCRRCRPQMPSWRRSLALRTCPCWVVLCSSVTRSVRSWACGWGLCTTAPAATTSSGTWPSRWACSRRLSTCRCVKRPSRRRRPLNITCAMALELRASCGHWRPSVRCAAGWPWYTRSRFRGGSGQSAVVMLLMRIELGSALVAPAGTGHAGAGRGMWGGRHLAWFAHRGIRVTGVDLTLQPPDGSQIGYRRPPW